LVCCVWHSFAASNYLYYLLFISLFNYYVVAITSWWIKDYHRWIYSKSRPSLLGGVGKIEPTNSKHSLSHAADLVVLSVREWCHICCYRSKRSDWAQATRGIWQRHYDGITCSAQVGKVRIKSIYDVWSYGEVDAKSSLFRLTLSLSRAFLFPPSSILAVTASHRHLQPIVVCFKITHIPFSGSIFDMFCGSCLPVYGLVEFTEIRHITICYAESLKCWECYSLVYRTWSENKLCKEKNKNKSQ